MDPMPPWFGQLHFSAPKPISVISNDLIPSRPGCYIFTSDDGRGLVPGEVLYVGKALDLRSRVRGYLVDWRRTSPTRHKGRAFLFEYRALHTDAQLFLRWTVYGDPAMLEASLIDLLSPQLNDRWEFPVFGDDERLDPGLMA
jgi:excinuclease UvrABC nuclease subunit